VRLAYAVNIAGSEPHPGELLQYCTPFPDTPGTFHVTTVNVSVGIAPQPTCVLLGLHPACLKANPSGAEAKLVPAIRKGMVISGYTSCASIDKLIHYISTPCLELHGK
jgi:hypothetical protein